MAHTTHSAPSHPRQHPPAGENPLGDVVVRLPGKAQSEDRQTREAWHGGAKLRSPYLTLLALPDSVAPGDVDAARDILDRVEAVLAITGRWTGHERTRLRRMKVAWEQRAAGQDSRFNLTGWQSGGARWWDRQTREMAGVGRVMNQIRHDIGDE